MLGFDRYQNLFKDLKTNQDFRGVRIIPRIPHELAANWLHINILNNKNIMLYAPALLIDDIT